MGPVTAQNGQIGVWIMATVDESIARRVMANGGHYEDDPQVQQVVTYFNMHGHKSWALLYEQDVAVDRYAPSPYVRDPEVVWRAEP